MGDPLDGPMSRDLFHELEVTKSTSKSLLQFVSLQTDCAKAMNTFGWQRQSVSQSCSNEALVQLPLPLSL